MKEYIVFDALPISNILVIICFNMFVAKLIYFYLNINDTGAILAFYTS